MGYIANLMLVLNEETKQTFLWAEKQYHHVTVSGFYKSIETSYPSGAV